MFSNSQSGFRTKIASPCTAALSAFAASPGWRLLALRALVLTAPE